MARKIAQFGVVTVRWHAENREYVCSIPGKARADYFTSDRDDAIATARDMAQRIACSAAVTL